MAEQRMALWVAEGEIHDDLQDVDPSLAIGNYGQNGHFDDGTCGRRPLYRHSSSHHFFGLSTAHIAQPPIDEATLLAVQQHMAQQAAFSQIPDVVKAVRRAINSEMTPSAKKNCLL